MSSFPSKKSANYTSFNFLRVDVARLLATIYSLQDSPTFRRERHALTVNSSEHVFTSELKSTRTRSKVIVRARRNIYISLRYASHYKILEFSRRR